MLYKFWQFVKNPFKYVRTRRLIKKRLEELTKRDPFIYK